MTTFLRFAIILCPLLRCFVASACDRTNKSGNGCVLSNELRLSFELLRFDNRNLLSSPNSFDLKTFAEYDNAVDVLLCADCGFSSTWSAFFFFF